VSRPPGDGVNPVLHFTAEIAVDGLDSGRFTFCTDAPRRRDLDFDQLYFRRARA
jgi:hypothetical protein